VTQVPDNNKYILSQRTVAFEADREIIVNDFLATILSAPTIQKQLKSLASGGTAQGISQKSLKNLNVKIPTKLEEQEDISNLIRLLSNIITLQQQKSDYLKQLKTTFLQKLFI